MNEMLIKWGFETVVVDNFENIAAEVARKILIYINHFILASPTKIIVHYL